MKSPVKVIVKEDDSVEKALDRTAEKLHNKYEKKRHIRMSFLKKLPVWQVVCLAVLQVFCCVSILFSAVACIASVNSRINYLEPNMLGYSYVSTQGYLKISNEKTLSLDEKIIVHTVDTSTLRPAMGDFMGDVIAYYTYSTTYSGVEIENLIPITEYSSKLSYRTSWKGLFGYQSDIITNAAKAGSSLVVHHIKGIYKDTSGTRYFLTYGNNIDVDDYYGASGGAYQGYLVREDMIIGAYDNTFIAKFNTLPLRAMQSGWGVVMLMLPLIIIIGIIILECLRDVQISKLQQDVIEEKRKITDSVCVENEVGFGMREADKRKVLAQADEKDRLTYISLLWRDGSAPAGIKKYLLRRRQMLGPTEELLEVNRTCQQMFRDGVDAKEIAKYYQAEKERIEKEETEIRRKMRALHKRYDDEEYQKQKAQIERLNQEVTEEMVSLQIQANNSQIIAPIEMSKPAKKAVKPQTKKAKTKEPKAHAKKSLNTKSAGTKTSVKEEKPKTKGKDSSKTTTKKSQKPFVKEEKTKVAPKTAKKEVVEKSRKTAVQKTALPKAEKVQTSKASKNSKTASVVSKKEVKAPAKKVVKEKVSKPKSTKSVQKVAEKKETKVQPKKTLTKASSKSKKTTK